MIIVDLSQITLSNLLAQMNGGRVEVSEHLVRHMILKALRSINMNFGKEYGEIVISSDSHKYWRRDIFPYYKMSRKKDRENSGLDWNHLFEILNRIKYEIRDNLPYRFVEIEGAESDDIIATLVLENKDDKYMIVSGDKDFIQLQTNPNVKQYAPIQKKYVTHEDPVAYLQEHILRGDRSDGIPNVLSADDVFVKGVKQKPLSKKRLAEWFETDYVPLGPETKKNYYRNKTLIDLNEIPESIKTKILDMYYNQKVAPKSNLLPYFINKQLKTLMEQLNDF